MNFSVRHSEQATYVDVQGDVVAGTGAALARLANQIQGARIVIDMGLVRTINSVGCKEWAQTLGLLSSRHSLEFVNCSIPFMDYSNMIPAMLGGRGADVQIKSFYAPYHCDGCNLDFKVLCELDDVRESRSLVQQPCPKCLRPVGAEVASEDYLIFLDRIR